LPGICAETDEEKNQYKKIALHKLWKSKRLQIVQNCAGLRYNNSECIWE